MEGLEPDVVLVGAASSRKEIYDYTGRLLRALHFPPLVSALGQFFRAAWGFSAVFCGRFAILRAGSSVGFAEHKRCRAEVFRADSVTGRPKITCPVSELSDLPTMR